MIELFTAPTPNGYKISIALEELGLAYRYQTLDLAKQEQKEDWFLAINPNGRIPAIIDHAHEGFAVFESGAILLYLAEKTGQLIPSDSLGRSRVIQWLMFQVGGLGPMMGQANVFYRYLPEKIPLAIERYQGESRRLLGVLNQQLKTHEYLAGDYYSIADIAHWAWARTHRWSGIEIHDFPHLKRWIDAIRARPAVARGIQTPPPPIDAQSDASKTAAFSSGIRGILELGKSAPPDPAQNPPNPR